MSAGSIHVIDQDGSNERRLTTGQGPLWSPDGKKILYRPAGGWGIINADGTGEVFISLPKRANEISSNWYRWYQWSPTGQQAVFSVESGPHAGIWVVDANGSALTQILKHEYGVKAATFSPDGKKIVYLAQLGSIAEGLNLDYNIFVVNSDGTNKRQLISDYILVAGPYYDSLTWSPDGKKITYTIGRSLLCVVDSDGRNKVSLTVGDFPVWSPDSKTIAFQVINHLGIRGGDDGLYLIKPDGTGRRKITSAVGTAKWSPDGTRIAVGSHIVNVDSGIVTTLSWTEDKGAYLSDWHWSP